MEWLPALQQILGEEVRVETGSAAREQTDPVLHGEERIALGNDQYLVVKREKINPQSLALIRVLAENGVLTAAKRSADWFYQLMHTAKADAGKWESIAKSAGRQIPLPAVIAILNSRSDAFSETDLAQAIPLLEEMLSDRGPRLWVEKQLSRIWFYIPLQENTKEELKQSAAKWLDTLSSELYLEGRLAMSQPAASLQNLLRAKQEAEIAFAAGTHYLSGQRIHLYGELGLARLLYGVTEETKAAFSDEVLPAEKKQALTQEFRETIQAFVQHGQNMAETARALFIHRNTLLYRLDKIQEITGKDIRKFQDLTVLWLALLLRNEQSTQ